MSDIDKATESETRSVTRRVVVGHVKSAKMDKTIMVSVERREKHSLYGKYVRRSSGIAAHDEDNSCQVGDFVEIVETRPISKRKSWRLQRVVKRAGEFEAAG